MHTQTFRRSLSLAAVSFVLGGIAYAQPPANPQGQPQPAPQAAPQPRAPEAEAAPAVPPGPPLPTVSLESLVERVAKSSKKSFLIDTRARQQVYLGTVRAEDVTYPLLLSILRTNNMAAVTIEGRVNIVPAGEMRFMAPLVERDDPNMPADEWVSRVITTTKKEASSMVPILRPMLPVTAHLAAMCDSQPGPPQNGPNCRLLIVVDRNANVQRIAAIVRMIDQ